MTQQPFLPERFNGRSADYLHWRDQRLQQQAHTDSAPISLSPSLHDPDDKSALIKICSQVADQGFAIYQWTEASQDPDHDVKHLHQRLSLQSFDHGVVHEGDGLSLLTDLSGSTQGRFIPYTSRAMSWHTDGYYNTMDQSLGCFTLHCINPAQSGGALTLLDHQLILIALHDQNSELVELLSHPQAMALPANQDDLGHNRPTRHSPVLFVRTDGTPGAHFTTRSKNIQWRTPETLQAATQMKQVIDHQHNWHFQIKLASGQGIITRNILHRREAYTDHPDKPRKMLRGRYLQTPHPVISANDHSGS